MAPSCNWRCKISRLLKARGLPAHLVLWPIQMIHRHHSPVMPGLDPGIHGSRHGHAAERGWPRQGHGCPVHDFAAIWAGQCDMLEYLQSSWPDLIRPSTPSPPTGSARRTAWITGSSPVMTTFKRGDQPREVISGLTTDLSKS